MSEVEKYLRKVSAGLYRLPESEQSEILSEIRNHIHEAESRQEPVQTVLERLGPPLRLAQSYANIHNIESGNTDFNIWRDMAFFFSAGLASYVVVPTLFIMAVTFPLTAVLTVALSILDFFIDIPWHDGVTFFSDTVHTGFPALVMSLILGVVLFFGGIFCWKLLKKYLAFISLRYKKFRMNK